MRLLSFVPCGCRAGPIDDAPPAAGAADHAGGARTTRRQRRRRTITGCAAPGNQWRPSLGDICEAGEHHGGGGNEAAVPANNKAPSRRGSRRVAPARVGKSSSWDVDRVLPRARGHEYRHLETASSLRGFAPTTFLF